MNELNRILELAGKKVIKEDEGNFSHSEINVGDRVTWKMTDDSETYFYGPGYGVVQSVNKDEGVAEVEHDMSRPWDSEYYTVILNKLKGPYPMTDSKITIRSTSDAGWEIIDNGETIGMVSLKEAVKLLDKWGTKIVDHNISNDQMKLVNGDRYIHRRGNLIPNLDHIDQIAADLDKNND